MNIVEPVVPARLGTPFRWLIASSWASNIGDGISLAAGPLLVASQTNDPTLVALAALLQRLPWLLFGLHAGVLADRVDRRVVVMAADGLRTVVLVALVGTIATGRISIGVVLAVMFLLGTAETFADTTTTAILPMVVEKRDLGIANARLMGGFILANQLAGPPIGAALRRRDVLAVRHPGRVRRPRRGAGLPGHAAEARNEGCRSGRRPVPGARRHPGGRPLAVVAPAGTHPGDHHRHLPRDVRLCLVGAGALLP